MCVTAANQNQTFAHCTHPVESRQMMSLPKITDSSQGLHLKPWDFKLYSKPAPLRNTRYVG